jgi:ABC-type amino acid transport substrate-binding protein
VNRDGNGRLRLVGLLAVGALAVGGLPGCGDGGDSSEGTTSTADTPSARDLGQDLSTLSNGELTVGARTSSPPFAIGYPPDVSGFEIDLADSIAGELGLDPVYVETSFAGVLDEAAGDDFDLAAPAAAVNPEKAGAVAFSHPYYEVQLVLVVPRESEVESVGDLAGAAVAVQDNTAGATYATDETAAATVRGFPGADDAIAAVATGGADAAILDQPGAVDQVGRQSEVEIVEEIPTGEFLAFVIPGGDLETKEAVDTALAALADEGKLSEINRDYFDSEPSEGVLSALGQ